jgi:hypothetical protein
VLHCIKSFVPKVERSVAVCKAHATKAVEAAGSLRSILDGRTVVADSCARLSHFSHLQSGFSYCRGTAVRPHQWHA